MAERDRILGTEVKIITQSEDKVSCGTITQTRADGQSKEEQTYVMACPVIQERSIGVYLSDSEGYPGPTHDYGKVVINLAEVTVNFVGN